MKPFFKSDSYHTDENYPRALMDKLVLNSRLYFISKFVTVILKSRSLALKGQYDSEAWASSSYDIFKITEECGGRIHISGMDNLQKCQGPVVFISNHMSTLEPMLFPCIIAPQMKVTYIIKDSLVTHPFFGPIVRTRDPIVVSRSNSREDLVTVMNKGQVLLAEGTSVIVFPQSTRRVDFRPKELNSLGVKLASKANVQVVPIAVKTDFWQNGKYVRDLGPIDRNKPIHIAFGEPISIDGMGKEEHKQVVDFISSHLDKWKENH
ncbi:MAG: glycerol acyltransferase [Gracilibacter sp. BRH_c7a]|nr:MAG: glycerol acyltransferase [Gracilibacter sp. BRH_c7a]